MTSIIYDVGVLGTGVAGSFACLRLAEEHKKMKVLAIDLGRPPLKRKRQTDGWLGCLPSSDGKFYLQDNVKITDLVGLRRTNAGSKWASNIIKNVSDFKIMRDKGVSINTEKRIKKCGYDITLNDHIQLYPKEIHALSKYMSSRIEELNNITFSFDNEIFNIVKQKGVFVISTEQQEFRCKKIVMAVGRTGWRWTHDIYKQFGIVENNNVARFGVRIEMPANYLKDFNKSNCTLLKSQDLEIGPFSWNGTVIPEDHVDLAISAFRSNENRWKTDKVSFSFIGHRFIEGNGVEQTDRIGKLSFILANDRIIKEKVSAIINKKSKISIIPEYDWLIQDLQNFSQVIPELLTKAYFHVPTITPITSNINIGNNLETEIDGMFVAGESAGITGLYAAATTGSIVAETICK